MFGNQSKPSQNWKFGIGSPIEGGEEINSQLSLAHRYKNELVFLERERRRQVQEIISATCPEYCEAESAMHAAIEAVQAFEDEMRAENSRNRKKSASKEQTEQLKKLRASRKEASANFKTIKKACFKNMNVRQQLDQLQAKHFDAMRNARAKCGLYWGTYLLIEDAAKANSKGRPPKFRSWDGCGRIGVQVQKGMSMPELYGGDDTRVWIERLDEQEIISLKKHHRVPAKTNSLLHFRIGSVGRFPKWAVFPMVLHRELPEAARLKWAVVHRNQIGHRKANGKYTERWTVVLTLSQDEQWEKNDRATSGACGIDVGWRVVDGELRVAVCVDDSGRTTELKLPGSLITAKAHLEKVQSDRANEFNRIQELVAEWMDAHIDELPEEMRERVRTIRSWKSYGRLINVAHWIRENKPDADIAGELEQWRKNESLAYQHARREEMRISGHRQQVYRQFAAEIRRKYSDVFIENIDWSELARRERVEEQKSEGIRYHQRIAACGELHQTLMMFASAQKLPAEYTTTDCHLCGHRNDVGPEQYRKCDSCGESWDQDVNAAENLLKAGLSPVTAG